MLWRTDRKSTRLNSSHTVIYTLSLHDALPICPPSLARALPHPGCNVSSDARAERLEVQVLFDAVEDRSEEHTSELQSHSDLHSFPTRRSSDLSAKPSTGPSPPGLQRVLRRPSGAPRGPGPVRCCGG